MTEPDRSDSSFASSTIRLQTAGEPLVDRLKQSRGGRIFLRICRVPSRGDAPLSLVGVLQSIGLYIATIVVTLIALWVTHGLSGADLSKPIRNFRADGILSVFVAKALGEDALLVNKRLGAPFELNYYDFFQPDTLHQFLLRRLVLMTGDPMLAVNLYFLGSFVLIAAASVFVFRRFGVAPVAALVCAVLYAFTPSHLFRSYNHLFLSAYFIAPLVFWIALRFMGGASTEVGERDKRPFWTRPLTFAAFSVAMAAGGSGVYYAAYSMLFFACAGLYAWFRMRLWQHAVSAFICVGLTALVTVWGMQPALRYTAQFGKNSEVAARSVGQTDVLSLKIAHLVLPQPQHPIESLRSISSDYNNALPAIHGNESQLAALGFAGTVGFLALVFWLIAGPLRTAADHLLHRLAALNAAGILYATTAGFASVFSLLVTPQLRAHNRIGLFLAFPALFALGLVLTRMRNSLSAGGVGPRIGFDALTCMILVLGLWDQTPAFLERDHLADAAAYDSQGRFIAGMEHTLPAGASVLQLPYVSFPEGATVHQLDNYDHLRAYIHSKTLRWSFPVMRGRPGDGWIQALSSRPAAELVRQAALAGYSAIYIDRAGYPDHGAAIESQIAQISGTTPVASLDGKLSFFNLRAYTTQLQRSLSPAEFAAASADARPDLFLTYPEGVFPEERDGPRSWRWCGQKGRLQVVNATSSERNVVLTIQVFSGTLQPSIATFRFGSESRAMQVTAAGNTFSWPLNLRPGANDVTFETNSPPVPTAPADTRKMHMRLESMRLEKTPANSATRSVPASAAAAK